MRRRLLAALGAMLLLTVLPVTRAEAAPAAPGASIAPLEHGHAHNDYINPQPLLGALNKGYTSIEADVFLRDGRLLLCHEFDGSTCRDDEGKATTAKPFESTYLQPLSNWITQYGGQVYADYTQPIYLYVEIKCTEIEVGEGEDAHKFCKLDSGEPLASDPNNPAYVYSRIVSALYAYRTMLFSVSGSVRHWGPVQVVITGGHNDQVYPISATAGASVRDLVGQAANRFAFLDGNMGDRSLYNADVVPTISFDPKIIHEDDKCRLKSGASMDSYWDQIVQAQTTGHHVRVFNTPDCPARGVGDTGAYRQARESGWETAIWNGVDYVGSNHLTRLHDWLTDNAQGGGGGDCGVSLWLDWAGHYGQFCSVRSGGVPVFRRPAQTAAQVGRLDEGGYANWFLGQQPGGVYNYYDPDTGELELTNYWWAYTQADNGAWGWVPLTYFTGGAPDQSANGLQYSCYDVRAGEAPACHPL